jgi:glutathione-regulated potassium-efflux system ancillary protein KefF
MADILLLAAHPDLANSHITQALLQAARAAGHGPGHLATRDLYALYPDYAIDIAAEQQALAEARLVIWLHPLHWYGMPALMKLWVDEVLAFGWAYGPGGQALQGKDLWLLSSTGGAAESYSASGHNEHPIDSFLLPYAQTARLCGLRWLPPLLLHGAHRIGDAAVQQHVRGFVQQLLSYPQWCPPRTELAAPEVPLDARPALFSSMTGGL